MKEPRPDRDPLGPWLDAPLIIVEYIDLALAAFARRGWEVMRTDEKPAPHPPGFDANIFCVILALVTGSVGY